jgi:hypothetical protein
LKKKLTDNDVNQLYESKFYYVNYTYKEICKKAKEAWAKDLVNNLEYVNNNFKRISSRLEKYFNKNKIQIDKRSNPFETIKFHKSMDISRYDELSDDDKKKYDI